MGGTPNQGKPAGGFWTTLPGIITAVAALVTAVGGIFFGLVGAGAVQLSSGPSPSGGVLAATSSSQPSPSPAVLGATPEPQRQDAELVISNIHVQSSANPELSMVVANTGDVAGTVIEVVFRMLSSDCVAGATALPVGVTPPPAAVTPEALAQAKYDIRFPSSPTAPAVFRWAPPELPQVPPGEAIEMVLRIGPDSGSPPFCNYLATISLRYLTGGRAVESDPFDPVELSTANS